jgi:hypothetical protein
VSRPRILLINPPGDRPYLRDGYCSSVAKGAYYWHPLDLLIQSGWLARSAEVEVLDAIIAGIGPERCLDQVAAGRYDAMLMLSGELSMEHDRRFAAAVTARCPQTAIFGTGDLFLFRGGVPADEYSNLCGVVTDFSAAGLSEYLAGRRGRLPGLRYLNRRGAEVGELPAEGPLRYPLPLHQAFPRDYRLPLGRDVPFASVLASYGCPHPCAFCHLSGIPYRTRPVGDIIEELSWLQAQGYRKLYFRDATFAASPRHSLELCQAMSKRGLCPQWSAFARPDRLDRRLIRAMAASGCTLLQFGLETPTPDTLDNYGKGYDRERTRDTFRACREAGVLTSGHYMIGLQGEDEQTWARIVHHADELGCDYITVNIAEARLGTSLDGGPPVSSLTRDRHLLDRGGLERGARQVSRAFYLRPSVILRHLSRIRSVAELRRALRLGLSI